MMKLLLFKKKLRTARRLFQERGFVTGLLIKYRQIIRSRKMKNIELSAKRGRLLRKRLPNGSKMLLWPDDAVSIGVYLNEYEVSEIDFINKMLKPGMVFVDVGANIGLYTVMASKLVGERGRVYSFEPASAIYDRLLLNIKYNMCRNVLPHRYAVSEINGIARMKVVGDGHAGWSSLGNTIEGKKFAMEDVETVSLDSVAKELKILGDIDLVKIDVEGWEWMVLAGANQVMSETNAPILMVEFTEENAQRNGVSCAELYRYIKQCGYDLYRYDAQSHCLIALKEDENYEYMNAVCVKRGRPLPNLS